MARARFGALDGLRGVAAVTVMGFHVTWTNHLTGYQFFKNGYLSVDLFFILSGFIISVAYDDRIDTLYAARDFMRRRFYRVYPLHFFILTCLVILECAKLVAFYRGGSIQNPFSGPTSLSLLIANIFFVQGTGLVSRTSWNVPSWSVSAEFVAYLLFAFAQLTGVVRIRFVVASAAIIGLVAYIVLAGSLRTLDLTYDFGIVRCLAGFAIGMAIYRARISGRLNWLEHQDFTRLSLYEIGAFAFTIVVMSFCTDGVETIAVLGFVGLVVFVQEDRGLFSTILKLPLFHWLGLISYSIYMVHVPIRNVMAMALPKLGVPWERTEAGRLLFYPDALTGDVLLIAFTAGVLLISWVTYTFVEKPAREFGRCRSGDAATPGQARV